MIIAPPVIDPDARIDFYAGSEKDFQLLRSIYNALNEERRGSFFASPSLIEDGIKFVRVKGNKLPGYNPLVIASYRDLHSIFYIAEDRPFIMVEVEYIRETRGLLKTVSLFLCGDDKSYAFRRINNNASIFRTNEQAVTKLLEYVKGKDVEVIKEVNGKSVGIIYMAWGEKALTSIRKSIASLKRLGYSYPVLVVGDCANMGITKQFQFMQWEWENPFDTSQRHNFQFRAGRIKPLLARSSPFDYTLYIDADTQFVQPIHSGFEMLKDYDMCVTEEKLTLAQLYNKKLAGWEINILERDATIIELGGDDNKKFINSGVIFFRSNKKVNKLFKDWRKEWLRFQEWDEQLALMRAIHNNQDVKVNYLPVQWNSPQPNQDTIVLHNYGRGDVRKDG